MAEPTSVDAELVEEARRLGGHSSEEEAVAAALRTYVQHHKRVAILDWVGKVEYDDDYDYKALRRGNSQ